jgi:predicted HD phosphohydrolase
MTRLAVRTGAPDDLIDAMLTRSHGDILRAPADSSSGEYDSWRQQFSRRDIRRLGEPMPTEPTAKWWPKVRSQFARRNRGTTERETP